MGDETVTWSREALTIGAGTADSPWQAGGIAGP